MAIQSRRGAYNKFDPQKLLPGEWAVVISGDPNAADGLAVYMCFKAGTVKRMATYEDMVENIANATEDVQEDFTAQLTEKISQAAAVIANTTLAANAANTAAENADDATQEALEAAEAANAYVLGDISQKTVDFSQAESRENINTGESTAALFGKIKKWFTDLGTAAFQAVANNLTTTGEGSVLDARQGKVLADKIGSLDELETTEKSDVVSAVNEVENSMQNGYVYANYPVSPGTITDIPVTFPKAFKSTPRVVAGMLSATTSATYGNLNCFVSNVTTDGFTLRVANGNTSGGALSPGFCWIAMV